MKIMNNQQLALELPIATCRRSHRALRAQWWFERMRQIIDLAPDPEPMDGEAQPASGGVQIAIRTNRHNDAA